MDKYIILTVGEKYYITPQCNNIKMAIYDYYKCIEGENTVFNKMCLGTTIFTIDELIKYFNSNTTYVEDEIDQIYILGDKIF